MSEDNWSQIIGCMQRVWIQAKKDQDFELAESTLYSLLLYLSAKDFILEGEEPSVFEALGCLN